MVSGIGKETNRIKGSDESIRPQRGKHKKSGISVPGNTACQSTEKDNAFVTPLFLSGRRVLIQL
jgi:hypothetical protein